MTVHSFFRDGSVDLDGLAAHFDGLDADARVATARELTKKEQASLFEAAQGRALTLEDFVPKGVGPLVEVIHHGKNSLAMFTHFQKRFCRPEAKKGELWGYNEQAMRWATGPGYFVARDAGKGEVVIDYHDVPEGTPPASWPKVLPNSARLSRFVYYRTRDFMRGVSKHVTIGRASRDDTPMDNWFVLVRDDQH
jgi:hypothetical protein